MDEYTNKIYARPDASGTVIKLFSSVFETPQEGDILVEEGREDYHAHVHLMYLLADEQGRYNYRITDGTMETIPEEEKPVISAPEPDGEYISDSEALAIILGGATA